MTMPSGTISMSDIRSEAGLSGAVSLGDSRIRSFGNDCSGAISMSSFQGGPNGACNMSWGTTVNTDWKEGLVSSGTVNVQTPTQSRQTGSFTVVHLWQNGAAASQTLSISGFTLASSTRGNGVYSYILYKAGATGTTISVSSNRTWVGLIYGFQTRDNRAISSVSVHGAQTSTGSVPSSIAHNGTCSSTTGYAWLLSSAAFSLNNYGIPLTTGGGGSQSAYTAGNTYFNTSANKIYHWAGGGYQCEVMGSNPPNTLTWSIASGSGGWGASTAWFGLQV